MKIAVASLGRDLNSLVSPSFGQAPFIIIADVEGNEIKDFEVVQNPALTVPGGRGITLAQFLVSKKVDAVVAGNFGWNVYALLGQAKIRMYSAPAIPVKEAVIKAASGELPEASPMGRKGKGWMFK